MIWRRPADPFGFLRARQLVDVGWEPRANAVSQLEGWSARIDPPVGDFAALGFQVVGGRDLFIERFTIELTGGVAHLVVGGRPPSTQTLVGEVINPNSSTLRYGAAVAPPGLDPWFRENAVAAVPLGFVVAEGAKGFNTLNGQNEMQQSLLPSGFIVRAGENFWVQNANAAGESMNLYLFYKRLEWQ